MRYVKFLGLALLAELTLATVLLQPVVVSANSGDKPEVQTQKPAGSNQQIKISSQGRVELDGVKVTAVAAPTITTTSSWGSVVFTWSVKTSGSTTFVRRFSGASALGEISVGDLLSVHGTLDTTTTQPTVNASWVKDWSIQTEQNTFRGTIQSINAGSQQLVLVTSRGAITVQASSTTQVRRGSTTITFGDLAVGETATASGLYNNLALTLQANKITAKQPERRVFSGTLKSLASTVKPTSLVLTVGTTDYTVQVAADTAIVARAWTHAALTDFTVGQQLKVYGTPHPGSPTTIDATVVQDLSLR